MGGHIGMLHSNGQYYVQHITKITQWQFNTITPFSPKMVQKITDFYGEWLHVPEWGMIYLVPFSWG